MIYAILHRVVYYLVYHPRAFSAALRHLLQIVGLRSDGNARPEHRRRHNPPRQTGRTWRDPHHGSGICPPGPVMQIVSLLRPASPGRQRHPVLPPVLHRFRRDPPLTQDHLVPVRSSHLPLSTALREVGVRLGVSCNPKDRHATPIRWRVQLDIVRDDPLLDYRHNRAAIRPEQAYSLRLFRSGWRRSISVKQFRGLEISDWPAMTRDATAT